TLLAKRAPPMTSLMLGLLATRLRFQQLYGLALTSPKHLAAANMRVALRYLPGQALWHTHYATHLKPFCPCLKTSPSLALTEKRVTVLKALVAAPLTNTFPPSYCRASNIPILSAAVTTHALAVNKHKSKTCSKPLNSTPTQLARIKKPRANNERSGFFRWAF